MDGIVDSGDNSAHVLLAENFFNTYMDCLLRMTTTMFVDCLLAGRFCHVIFLTLSLDLDFYRIGKEESFSDMLPSKVFTQHVITLVVRKKHKNSVLYES